MLGSVSAVDEVNTVVLGSATVAGEAGSLVGIGRSLVVIKGISLSLMPPLGLVAQALIINTTTTTHNVTTTVIAMIAVVAVFME